MKTRTVWSSIGILIVFLLCATTAFSAMRKGPYLMYEGTNTSMTVLWQTDLTESNVIRWGTDTGYGAGQATSTEYDTDHQHKYLIAGLQPGVMYYYQIDGYAAGSFRAAPAADAVSVKFLAYGDTRSYPANHETVASGMRTRYTADSALRTILLHDGDFVYADTETGWTDSYFVSGASYTNMRALQAEIPVIGARGNHEGTGTVYKKYFPYPYAAAYYWSFDYGPAHIVVLDEYSSYAEGSAQYDWLLNDLSSTNRPWKIILTHEPGWGAGTHANNVDIQNIIHPLVKQYGVDLFINGHNHNYARALVEDNN
jgi:hypothetical protein